MQVGLKNLSWFSKRYYCCFYLWWELTMLKHTQLNTLKCKWQDFRHFYSFWNHIKHFYFILTSLWVLRTPNAGWNCSLSGNKTLDQHFGSNLKKQFFYILLQISNFFAFFSFLAQKNRKCIFWPAFGVRSTQMLVEIYNIHSSSL